MNSYSKIFIIAGEASGDMNGALLVGDIIKINPNIFFAGIGGPKLKELNVKLLYEYNTVNYIGFSNVLKNIRKIRKILNEMVKYVETLNPDIIILIDFPGFNLKFAELVKKFYKGKIIYYISPQIWAWHKNRIEKIKKYIDRMLVILPFEVEFYKKLNYKVDYVGHPLVRKINKFLELNKKIDSDNLNICLLPGSRLEEIQRILPTLTCVTEMLRSEYNAEINLIYPENISPIIYKKILKGKYCNLISNNEDNHLKILLNSDLVLTKFGTTTLELTLLNTPFISVYKAGSLNYFLAKMLSNVKYLSMPNIISGKQIVKEFIQSDMTAENIFREAERILTDKSYKDKMLTGFREVQNIFNNTAVNQSAAEIIMGELQDSIQ